MTIAINLDSLALVNTFATALAHCNFTFDLSLNFTWDPSKLQVWTALEHLSECDTGVLLINRMTLNFRQGPLEYGRDLFA